MSKNVVRSYRGDAVDILASTIDRERGVAYSSLLKTSKTSKSAEPDLEVKEEDVVEVMDSVQDSTPDIDDSVLESEDGGEEDGGEN